MPSKKKKYNARFPPARIKKIMQTNEDVGKVAAPVPVIISRALELFVESLIKKASDITRGRNAKTLTTSHLKLCILADGNFHFLKDLVAEIPDVQGEDDLSTSVICDNQTLPLVVHQSRSRRQRDRASGDSAGPSQSTADESETWSAEDDGEGDSENSSSETTSDHQVVSSVPPAALPATYNLAFSSSASHCYLQQKIPHMQNCDAASSADDDDYDS